MKNINIRMYGALRKYFPTGLLKIDLPEDCDVMTLRQILLKEIVILCPDFKDSTLLFESAFANNDEILQDTDIVCLQSEIALLPPVCGG